jgi:hypothetical protein
MMDWSMLVGPMVRQLVQWGAGALLGAGVVTHNDVAAISGAIVSLINIGFVIHARTRK